MIIAVDFDGTCVYHEFPVVGGDVPNAVDVLKELANRHKLILYTMRSGDKLEDAIAWFREREIPLWAANGNPQQASWTRSPKVYAHKYIDDAAVGVPLIYDPTVCARPFVDWIKVQEILQDEHERRFGLNGKAREG